jgi:hypothetical protein
LFISHFILSGGTGKWFSSLGFSKTPLIYCYVRPWSKVKLSTSSIKHELFSQNNILIKKEGGMYEEHDVHFVFPNPKNAGSQRIPLLKCPCSLAFSGDPSRVSSKKWTEVNSELGTSRRASSKKRIDYAGDPNEPSTSGTKSEEYSHPHLRASGSVKDHNVVTPEFYGTTRAEQHSSSEIVSETSGQPRRPFPEAGEEKKTKKMEARVSHHFEPYESRYDDEMVQTRAEEKNFITTFRDERPHEHFRDQESFNEKSQSSEQEIETQLESEREIAKQELLFRHTISEHEEIQSSGKEEKETVIREDASNSEDVHARRRKETSHSASLENGSKATSVKTTPNNTSSSIMYGLKQKLYKTFKWKEKENTTAEKNMRDEKLDHLPSNKHELEKVADNSSVSKQEREKTETSDIVKGEKNIIPFSLEKHESHQRSTASELEQSHSESNMTLEEHTAKEIRVLPSEDKNRVSSMEYTERSDGKVILSTEMTETTSSATLEIMKKDRDRSSMAKRNVSSKSAETKKLKDSASEENAKHAIVESQNPPQESYFQSIKKRIWGSPSPVVENKKQPALSQETKEHSSSEEHAEHKQEVVKPQSPTQETNKDVQL